ncbi:MAG: hypothetical protein ACQCXQ_02615 [Verrucomicrobiales bacterium]|nr:hypothetical protein [Verrucomicrobiota bacterium JB025]
MTFRICRLCFLMLAWSPTLPANESVWRTWVSAAGTKIEARVIDWTPCPRIEASAMTLETTDGRKLPVSFKHLSPADQAWLINHHKADLIGAAPATIAPGASSPAEQDVRVFKQRTTRLDPDQLFLPPHQVNWDRSMIPSRGGYEDSKSRGADLVANHLFWLTKAGYTKYEIDSDESKTWEKIHRDVRRRFRGGNSHRVEEVMDLAVEMLTREGKGIRKINCWDVAVLEEGAIELALQGSALVLIEPDAGKINNEKQTEWQAVLPILTMKWPSLTVSRDGNRPKLKLEAIPENADASAKSNLTGQKSYRLATDPGDTGKLALRLADEELELRIGKTRTSNYGGQIFILDLDLAPPQQAAE